jgi:hypothetical protein
MSSPSPFNPLSGNPLHARGDVQRAVRDLFEPLVAHYQRGGARVRLGGGGAAHDEVAAELEAFARPLWGTVPLTAGGGDFAHWCLFLRGLASGTDPAGADYWGPAAHRDQRMVEMAAIGFALALVPERIWEPLTAAERSRLVTWLQAINSRQLYPNNWQFFRVLVNLGLARVGAGPSWAEMERSLDAVESHYVADGWYSDGRGMATHDHYCGWAYHYYGLIYAVLAAERDPARADRFRERARRFAQSFQHWFDPQGSVVPYGRSLTYRFAAASFWGALAFAGEEALPWGRIKGLYLRHLREWSAHPIADASGVLRIGYRYDNLFVSEAYIGPGSPYWAMKCFLPLALPDRHPFWEAEEEPLPVLEGLSIEPVPCVVLSRDVSQAQMLCAGQGQWLVRDGAAKYSKFAYSSRFGFSLDNLRSAKDAFTDSTLMLWRDDGQQRVRERVDECRIAGELVVSRWRPWPDVVVDTVLSGKAPWHTRLHRVRTPRPLRVAESGFAIPWDGASARLGRRRENAAVVRTATGISAIFALQPQRAPRVIRLPPNSNLVAPRSVMPVLESTLPAGDHLLACAVVASEAAVDLDSPPAIPAKAWDLLGGTGTGPKPAG